MAFSTAMLSADFGSGRASGKAASEFNSTLRQSSHSLATRVQGFPTKTTLAREIPPATQASEDYTQSGNKYCKLELETWSNPTNWTDIYKTQRS